LKTFLLKGGFQYTPKEFERWKILKRAEEDGADSDELFRLAQKLKNER